MTKFIRISAPLLLPLVAIALAGCSKEPAAPPVTVVEEEAVEEVEVPAVDTSGAETDGDEITAALAELSEADRTAALAQKVCPVSDEPLGSMGAPLKVTIDGRDVFICCESCRKSLEEDPAKYLAKLDAAK